MKIMSITEIIALLKFQAAARAPENDEGGLLEEAATNLEKARQQLEEDGGS